MRMGLGLGLGLGRQAATSYAPTSLSGNWSSWTLSSSGAGATITPITYAQYLSEGGEAVPYPPTHVAKIVTHAPGVAYTHAVIRSWGSAATFNFGALRGMVCRVFFPPAQWSKVSRTATFNPRLLVNSTNYRSFKTKTAASDSSWSGLNIYHWQPGSTSEFSEFSADTGTYTAATAYQVYLRVTGDATDNAPGDPLTYYVLDLSAINANVTPRVVFTWDDSAISQYVEMFPLAQTHDIPGSLFMIPSAMPVSPSAYMSVSQTNEMLASGLFDGGMHSSTVYETLTTAGLQGEIATQLAAIASKSITASRTSSMLALPEGAFEAGTTDGGDILGILQGLGYTAIRGTGFGVEGKNSGINVRFCRSISLGNATGYIENLADFQSALTMIAASGEDLIIRGHKVEATPSESNGITPTNLAAIFAEARSQMNQGLIQLMSFGQYVP